MSVKSAANFADSWWKIIVLAMSLVTGVSSCVLAWVQIETNAIDIEQFHIDYDKEMVMRDERSDKRYQRALKIAEKLESQLARLKERVRKLEKEISINTALDNERH